MGERKRMRSAQGRLASQKYINLAWYMERLSDGIPQAMFLSAHRNG